MVNVLLERFFSVLAGNDVLICGTCKSMYSSLATFVQHKKQKCELKTLCRCQNQPIVENSLSGKSYFPCAVLSGNCILDCHFRAVVLNLQP